MRYRELPDARNLQTADPDFHKFPNHILRSVSRVRILAHMDTTKFKLLLAGDLKIASAAKELGMNPTALSRLLTGYQVASFDVVYALAEWGDESRKVVREALNERVRDRMKREEKSK